MSKDTGSKRIFIIYILLVLITVGAYWQVFGNGFINFDDGAYVYKNANVMSGLNWQSIGWAFSNIKLTGNWHPLTWISCELDAQIYHLKPWGFHLTSLLLHLINVLLLFAFLRRVTRSTWPSAFAAALFAIHPLHVESVAWIAERKDVLSTMFWMLTMMAYVWYTELPSAKRYLLILLMFILGLMSKPMLVSLPLVLLLIDLWPLNRIAFGQPERKNKKQVDTRIPLRRAVLEKIPLFVISLVMCAVTIFVQRSGGAMDNQPLPFSWRADNAIVSCVSYILRMLWPSNLVIFYVHPLNSLPVWQIICSAILLAGMTYAAIKMVKGRPYILVGWLWFIVALIPVIGLVQVGGQGMADRYTYVPLIGLFMIIAWGVPDLIDRLAPGRLGLLLGIGSAVVVVVLCGFTWVQVGYWHNNITLYEHALACNANNSLAHANLGSYLLEERKYRQALPHLEKALAIYPNTADGQANYGALLAVLGRTDEAIAHCTRAVELEPKVTTHYNLGIAYASAGKMEEAEKQFRKAVEIDPTVPAAQAYLGKALLQSGRQEEAIEHLRKAVEINPSNAEAFHNLGIALGMLGRYEEGVDYLRKAAELTPDDVSIHYDLAFNLYNCNRLEDAAAEFRRAIQLEPNMAKGHYNLAQVLIKAGKKSEALAELQKAVETGTASKEAILVERARAMISAVKSGQM